MLPSHLLRDDNTFSHLELASQFLMNYLFYLWIVCWLAHQPLQHSWRYSFGLFDKYWIMLVVPSHLPLHTRHMSLTCQKYNRSVLTASPFLFFQICEVGGSGYHHHHHPQKDLAKFCLQVRSERKVEKFKESFYIFATLGHFFSSRKCLCTCRKDLSFCPQVVKFRLKKNH